MAQGTNAQMLRLKLAVVGAFWLWFVYDDLWLLEIFRLNCFHTTLFLPLKRYTKPAIPEKQMKETVHKPFSFSEICFERLTSIIAVTINTSVAIIPIVNKMPAASIFWIFSSAPISTAIIPNQKLVFTRVDNFIVDSFAIFEVFNNKSTYFLLFKKCSV